MQSSESMTSASAKYELIDAMSSSRGTRYLDENPGAIDALNDQDLAECMFTAATFGYVLVMDALWAKRGPFPVVYENEEGSFYGRLNGEYFEPRRTKLLPFASKIGRLRNIFDAIRKYELKGLIEPGPTYPFLFSEINLSTLVAIGMRRFRGQLPFLSDNALHWPELAAHMEAEAQRSGMLEAYMPMLCWATEKMITQHGANLIPLRTMQQVVFREAEASGSMDTDKLFTRSMDSFKADRRLGDQVVIQKMVLGITPDERHSSSVGLLLSTMGTEDIDYGFSDSEGRVLCQTRANFLMGFDLQPGCSENEGKAHQFILRGFPLGILANHVAKVCQEQFAHDLSKIQHPTQFSRPMQKECDAGSQSFFNLNFYSSGIGQKLVGMLRVDQWRSLFKYCSTSNLHPKGLLAFRDAYQMDNQGIHVHINPEAVFDLNEAQYRFRDGTVAVLTESEYDEVVKNHPDSTCVLLNIESGHIGWIYGVSDEHELFNECVRLHSMLQNMNIWTGNGPAAPDAKQALDNLLSLGGQDVKSIRSMGLVAHLIKLGAKDCAQAAITPEHWNLIVRLFDADDLRPYLAAMPRQARGLVLESGLGL